MNRSPLALAVVFTFLLVPLGASLDICAEEVPSEPDAPPIEPSEPEESTICGWVGDVSDTKKNTPLQLVEVTLLDGSKQEIGNSYLTSDDGYFELACEDREGAFLKFDKPGYAVRTQPGKLQPVKEESNMLSFDLEDMKPDENGRYYVSGTVEERSFIGMGITTSVFSGYVHDETGAPLDDATVTLTAIGGDTVIRMHTDGDGYFQGDCPYGTYSLTASCKGFQNYTHDKTVGASSGPLEIQMTERTHEVLFGMDTPHAWEFVSLVIVAMMVLSFALVHYRIKKGRTEVVLVNDLDDEEEDLRSP